MVAASSLSLCYKTCEVRLWFWKNLFFLSECFRAEELFDCLDPAFAFPWSPNMREPLKWCISLMKFLSRGKARKKPRRVVERRGLTLECLERREVFSASGLAGLPWRLTGHDGVPVGDKDVMIVPSGESPVHFFLDSRNTRYNDELGYFFTDGPDGRITRRVDDNPDGLPLLDSQGRPQYVRPGDADYALYALASNNSATVFGNGEVANHGQADKILDVLGDHYFGFYVVQDGSADQWRESPPGQKPNLWFSVDQANSDEHDHFHLTRPDSPDYRANIQQYQVEDSTFVRGQTCVSPPANFDDLVFSVNIVPFAYESDYTVYNAGSDFSGAPQAFKADTPDDPINRGLGLLFPDKSFNGHSLTVTDVKLYLDDAEWQPVGNSHSHSGRTTLNDPSLHGQLTVYSNGGVAFKPDTSDPYWHISEADPEPEPVYIEYRISDGIDTAESYVGIGHGFYHRGGVEDRKHDGQNMYLLDGGGYSPLTDGLSTRFFTEGSRGQDIVLIGQGVTHKDLADYVYDIYAGGGARSVTSLNITTREQADDPRLARIIDGADAIWFRGGAQSIYQTTWQGTLLFDALARAAAGHTAIGGTSAGMAILCQQAYVELHWDSVESSFATLAPLDERIHLVSNGLPFGGLSDSPGDPLYHIVTDTHFSVRDRLGRLITFTARAGSPSFNGLGVDQDTSLLIEKNGSDWIWTVAGEGSVYFVSPETGVTRPKYQDHQRLTYAVNALRLDAGTSQKVSDIRQAAPTYQVVVSKGTVFSIGNGGQLY
jgi:cyanophycinase